MFLTKNKKAVIDIPEPGDYQISEVDDDLKSCGLEGQKESFLKRADLVFDNELKVNPKKENAVAVIAQKLEECLSKRELAYLLSKQSLILMQNTQGKSEKS